MTPYACWLWWAAVNLHSPIDFAALPPEVCDDIAYLCKTEIPWPDSHLIEMGQALNVLAEVKRGADTM